MLSKAVIKYIHSLKTKKYRGIHQAFIAEGTKTVLDIAHSQLRILSVYATEQWITRNKEKMGQLEMACITVTPAELKTISSLSTPQEVLAVVQIPEHHLEPDRFTGQLIIMLDEIRDPGNLGTIVRTADWFGIRHIICSTGCVDVYNSKVVQATMGSIARINVYYTDLVLFLEKRDPSIPIYGFLLHGEDIRKIKPVDKGILLFGNEAGGISSALIPYIQIPLTIPSVKGSGYPTHNAIESLNVAQACSIACYAFRQ